MSWTIIVKDSISGDEILNEPGLTRHRLIGLIDRYTEYEEDHEITITLD